MNVIPSSDLRILDRCLKGKSETGFTANALSRKAHWRWDREQHIEAAVLFLAAERVARAAGGEAARHAFSYRVRAGVNFSRAGEMDRARPILHEATTFDWQATNLMIDCHMSEWAFVELLAEAYRAGDKGRFLALFDQAVERGAKLGTAFSMIHPHQDQLLRWCHDLRLVEQFEIIEKVALSYRGDSTKLKRLIRDLRATLTSDV